MCFFNAASLHKILQYKQEMKKTFLLPFAASAVMGAAVRGLYGLLYEETKSNLIALMTAIGVGILLYFALLLVFRCVDEVELAAMPFGRPLVSLGKKLHLL